MLKTLVNVETGEQVEVICKPYRNAEWVVLLLADFEEVPDGFFEFDAATEKKPDPEGELAWALSEITQAKDALEALGFGDETVAGTEDQWKSYGRSLRAWRDGAEGFPQPEHRPARPS